MSNSVPNAALDKTYPYGWLPAEIGRERNSQATKLLDHSCGSFRELQTTLRYLEAGSSCIQEWLRAFAHANADKSLRPGGKGPQEKGINHRPEGGKTGKCAEILLLSEESDEEKEKQREEAQEEDQREQEDEEELEREGADESAEEERDEDRREQDEEEREQEGTRLKGRQLVKVKKPKSKSP
jgi:hypothetical protein